MERWKESQLKQLAASAELEIAYGVSLSFAKNMGFDFFAFSTSYASKTDDFNTVRLNNYPSDWNSVYEKKKLAAIDPIVAHCHQSAMPILWSEEQFSNARCLWSQAIHDEETDLCSILSLVRSHRPISAWELYENLGFSVFMGHHLHKLAVRSLPKRPATPSNPQLSLREIDVLKLAADGKTAYESARILNLSPRTINFHVQETIRKFGVSNKISAVIAAAKAGYLDRNAIG